MRVSTEDQKDFGYSLAAQEEMLRRWCVATNRQVIKVYVEDHSAKTLDRPQFKELMEFVRTHKDEIDEILFVKWDRFTRNTGDAYNMIKYFAKLGVTVNAVEQPINSNIPEQKILLAFYLAVPEVDNDRRAMSTRSGMRRAMKEGRWVHHPPKGYVTKRDEKDKPLLVPGPTSHLIKRAFEEVSQGTFTLEAIRKLLAKEGLKCSKSQFARLLRNPIYMGMIPVPAWNDEKEELVQGLHEAIVPESLFQKVQMMLDGGSQSRQPRHDNPEFPLRGFIDCIHCGKPLTGSASKGNGGRYLYYHCQHHCQSVRVEIAEKELMEFLQSFKTPPAVERLFLAIAEDIYNTRKTERAEKTKESETDLASQRSRLIVLDDKFVAGEITAEDYNRMSKAIRKRIQELEIRKAELMAADGDFVKYLRFAVSMLNNLGELYRGATLDGKSRLLSSIFPGKLVYTEPSYRTKGINVVLELFSQFSEQIQQTQESPNHNITPESHQVALTGSSCTLKIHA